MTEHTTDPLARPDIPQGGRRVMTVLAAALGVGALWLFALGVVGMVLGTLAHAKGDRLGLPAAFLAGAGTIAGMAVVFFTRT